VSEPSEQAAKILGPLAGTATVWCLDLGLRLGIFGYLAERPPGATADEVSTVLGLDPQYTAVILRAAYAAEVLDRDDGRYRLAEHMATLLLDADAPGYLGGAVRTFVALRETYLDLRRFARTGEREWWSDFDPEWIDAVGENGQTYYRRLLNVVAPRLPAVADCFERGARYLDLACGLCRGPAKVAAAFPGTTITAVDGDPYTLEVAEREMKEAGLGDRFRFVHLHDRGPRHRRRPRPGRGQHLAARGPRHRAGGGAGPCRPRPWRHVPRVGVPLPRARGGLPDRSRPADVRRPVLRGCQLLPTTRFVDLLERAGFRDVGVIDVTPVHVVVHGTK